MVVEMEPERAVEAARARRCTWGEGTVSAFDLGGHVDGIEVVDAADFGDVSVAQGRLGSCSHCGY